MAKNTKLNISGSWKRVGDIFTRVGGSWKDVQRAYIRASGVWKVVHSFEIPTGLIIPYDGVSAPSGWDLFTGADGSWIIGAGTTYSPGDNGAGTGGALPYSSYAGSHEGDNSSFALGWADGNDSVINNGDDNIKGNHRQRPSTGISIVPPYEQLRLIKAQAGNEFFPEDGLVLGIQDFSGLSNVKANGRLLKADTTIGSAAGTSTSGSITTNNPGGHIHEDHREHTFVAFDSAAKYISAGGHTHTVTLSITWALKRFYLSAWTNASADFFGATGMIGMYESITPPLGWALCDGNNGTPDLRDYFIQLDSSANDNQSAGDNTVNFTGTTSTDGAHDHDGGPLANSQETGSANHKNSYGGHSHDFDDDLSWLPPYYSLAFMMYTE